MELEKRLTQISKVTYADCKILSMPFGPRVLFTKSPTAIAPTKAERRAFSPFSSVTSSAKIWVGLKEAMIVIEAPIISSAARTRRFLENANAKILGALATVTEISPHF